MAEWYEQSFGEDYLLVYKHRDFQGAKREVHKMISWLGLPSGAKILDLCCGMGRHAMALEEAGYEVTGVDLSEVLLREARRNDPDQRVTWMHADMRNLPLSGGFDAVVNLFTSFGYFDQDAEHIKVLKEVRRMLKPGGQFIIDFLNPEYTMAHLVPESERTYDGQLIKERRVIEDGYVKKRIEIIDQTGAADLGTGPRHYLERIKLYSLEDFTAMLEEAGLGLKEIYGSYDEDSFDPLVSPRMIMVGDVSS
ncbi:class I SAM-dependent methyltransferase [Paenibacillus motobuensis]|uniref:class I SAM-dependent methyltransferase n=1 Tax=Paenibacillus TaxID=44249 RepID=UPI0020412792|nr:MULTISPECIES: class I SAM-dependent methyltransferase [Paenibacillus]MCM3041877.1 class I SAM-dependent methyltransferase [Paenibacillus lutimineralis]MCM3648981.1 class I SAM-dependent methyltransferase [Paenibacillus motobuensis]